MADSVTLKDDGLKKLIKAFKGKIPVARVGILGDSLRTVAPKEISHSEIVRRKTAKKPEKAKPVSNAVVGARWEYDAKWKRSFLRVPIMDHLSVRLSRLGAFKKATIDEVLKSGDLEPYIRRMGEVGYQIVIDAFSTGGFGKWVASNMKRKKNHQTLIESQQLLDSIQMDVK